MAREYGVSRSATTLRYGPWALFTGTLCPFKSAHSSAPLGTSAHRPNNFYLLGPQLTYQLHYSSKLAVRHHRV